MTITDRITDLSTIWKHATMVYPYFDRYPDQWDALYHQYLQRALVTADEQEFHLLLAEFMAQLGDGHTVYDFPREFLQRVGVLPFSLKYCADGYYISEIEESHAQYLYGKIQQINGIPFADLLRQAFRYIYHVEDYAPGFQLHRILPLLLRTEGNEMVTSKGTFYFDLLKHADSTATTNRRILAPQPQASYPYEKIDTGRLDIRRYHATQTQEILYIKIDNFLYSRTAEEVAVAIQEVCASSQQDIAETNSKDASSNPTVAGIILDLRDNIGGMTKFGGDVAKLFISGEFHGCQKRTQSMRGIDLACASQYMTMSEEEIEATLAAGLGTREGIEESLRFGRHCHYEEYQDTYGEPGHVALTDLPCVILTSRDTISAAEDTVAMFRSNHRATIMGTPTTGTTGTPMLQPLVCGGRARICSVGYRLLDGTEFIGVGIQPDVMVETRLKDLEKGVDTVLNQAIGSFSSNTKPRFYHGSSIPGIQTLEPRSRRHSATLYKSDSEGLVYLTTNIPYALVYIWDSEKTGSSAKWVTCGIRDGVTFYEEQFPNQLRAFYQGVSGYLYVVEDTEPTPVTDRECMYVSQKPLHVSQMIPIRDIYDELLRHEREGSIQIRRFTEQPQKMQEKLTNRIVMYIQQKQLLHADSEEAYFIQKYFTEAWSLAACAERDAVK